MIAALPTAAAIHMSLDIYSTGILQAMAVCLQHVQHCMQVLEQDLLLAAGSTQHVTLQLLPFRPGVLQITGLEWILNDSCTGRFLFPQAERQQQHRRTGSRWAMHLPLSRYTLCKPMCAVAIHSAVWSMLVKIALPRSVTGYLRHPKAAGSPTPA